MPSEGEEERVREARTEVSSKEAFHGEVPEVPLSNLYRESRVKQASLSLSACKHTLTLPALT